VNLVDENVPAEQREFLRSWRITVRQIGRDLGWSGMDDEQIIPLLHTVRRPTFFTLDSDFYERTLCHERYCLVCMDVRDDEAASFVRRFLRHPQFDTQAKRMGAVVRLSPIGIRAWRVGVEAERYVEWP
jgi:predicted nuclease of predicted toxin-antitoxin system